MNITPVTKALARVSGRMGLVLAKHSPTILMGVGIVGTVGAAVMACRSTLKVTAVLAEHKETVEKIHYVYNDIQNTKLDGGSITYSAEDQQKDLVTTYVKTAGNLIKLYAPAVLLGGASIACIIGGHGILSKRNVALAAAYKAVEEGFKEYRKRVAEEYGEDKDYMFKHGLKAEKITETVTDDKGKTKTVEKDIVSLDKDRNASRYARFYDDGCTNWSKDPELNLFFLKTTQCYYNDMLQIRGHVFLNEIYDALNLPRTKEGAVVGWLRDHGDGFIDFGIFDGDSPRRRDFVNGYENVILLDFNVDGPIYDKI